MTTKTTAAPTLVQQAYLDAELTLDAFGEPGLDTTAADVQRAHVIWHSIPEDQRHIVALCFHQFDAQRDIFDLPVEEACERPEEPDLGDLPRGIEDAEDRPVA